ncbi:MAG: hypothetical protein LBR80_02475 [Deltaproteobacteria bacterium]|jgi:hypothetical protein|nr:hypothetical protein [Deltaproteobacteria bacterium]
MTQDLKPMETLLTLDLLSRGGESFLKDFDGSPYDLAFRKQLSTLGLITETKRRYPVAPGEKPVRPLIFLTLTDKGWSHVESLMHSPSITLPPKSTKCAPVMSRLLRHVGSFMDRNDFTISEMFGEPLVGDDTRTPEPNREPLYDPAQEPFPGLVPGPDDFFRRLQSLSREHSSHGGAIKITDIKRLCRDVPRDAVDRLLIDLQNQGRIALYTHISKEFETEEDRTDAVIVAGQPRHFLYFTR